MVKLNLGGGSGWKVKGWTNLERKLGYNLEKLYLKKFSDNSVSLIFFSHCLEHLSWSSVPIILSDCYRVLKPNGLMRVVVPDVDIYYRLLRDNNKNYLIEGNPHFYSNKKFRNRNLLEDVKEMMGYFGDHKSFFNYSILYIMLRIAGFRKIEKKSFSDSNCEEMRKEAILNDKGMPISGFDNKFTKNISLYVECIK